ncbi:hypothetical protein K435DRAFT_793152 [Dendrothele bispora CBS 962.96]|uniref:Brl1/Brr6 domain-containing protein n=1 Tax=Dendrothele bispora (strain CBS 962.96) TaxID=1314807 RepID=A0A4S8MG90_DENBC|nr:hypothetical protein K435DRAFT_793152 [Dendrothele bispora CBS 962.96]
MSTLSTPQDAPSTDATSTEQSTSAHSASASSSASDTRILSAPMGFTFKQAIRLRPDHFNFLGNRTFRWIAGKPMALIKWAGTLVVLYMLYLFMGSFLVDTEAAKQILFEDLHFEALLCARRFTENKCERPLPAMELQCGEWKKCIDRPVVGRAAVYIDEITKLINQFFAVLEPRSLLGLAVLILVIMNSRR